MAAAATGGPVLGVHYRAFEKIRNFGLAKLVAPTRPTKR
jgi:hypothetical protein